MFLLPNGYIVLSINNVSKYRSGIKEMKCFGWTKSFRNAPLSSLSSLCSPELLLVQPSSVGTYHAAAGHTLFLPLHSLEFSTLDQFRWTSACVPPLLLLAHLRSVCLDDTANQRKEGRGGKKKQQHRRGKINSKSEIYFKLYGGCKNLNYGAKENKQGKENSFGHKRLLPG